MFKPVARIITRASDDPNDGMIIGVRFKGSTLKEGRVYEITDFDGELFIKDIGPTAIQKTITDYNGKGYNLEFCWGNSISQIVGNKGYTFLTEEEMQKKCKR